MENLQLVSGESFPACLQQSTHDQIHTSGAPLRVPPRIKKIMRENPMQYQLVLNPIQRRQEQYQDTNKSTPMMIVPTQPTVWDPLAGN